MINLKQGGNISKQKRKMKILLVGVSERLTQRIGTIFSGSNEPTGQFVTIASVFDSNDAMVQFGLEHPDLLIIDGALDHIAAKSLCQDIRRQEGNRHTGIIFVADRDTHGEDLVGECLEVGADDFVEERCPDPEILACIKAVLRLKAMTDELRSVNHRLQMLSLTDELTGLANMRCFNQRLSSALRLVRNGQSGLGIFMLDLDHFKEVNDNTNHLVGSHVISGVGKVIREMGILQGLDLGARYGGDEFILFCVTLSSEEIAKRGEMIRKAIEDHEFKYDGHSIRITASIGTAWVAPGYAGNAEEPIKAADTMLYKSKLAGRNRVSGITLGNPVNLDHVGRTHLVDWNSSGDYYRITRFGKS